MAKQINSHASSDTQLHNKPKRSVSIWFVGAANSEIDSEQHLRWLRPTFPLRFLADDKRGRQVGPSDPPRAHILLNTDPDYP